ncbi:MAG: hypothetical protein VSS75_032480 [Candidatus Parabeggiatoa sp.]|nr:hypothetical protein [Candidatus Parabeggiatoa sp.]
MKITLNDNSYPVYKLKLILETDSCPKIELQFGHGNYPSIEESIDLANTEATLSWESDDLTLQVIGFEESTIPTHIPNKNEYQLLMTGLVLPKALETWFKTISKEDKPLIYQKNEFTDVETGDVFLTRLLGNKVILRENEKSLFNKLLPAFATFWRPPKQDNFSFMCHLIDFIRSQAPRIKGWAAFQSGETPLRLVSTSSKPLELDEQWVPRGQFPTNQYAGKVWAQEPFELVRRFATKNPLALLPELVSKGQQKTDEIQGGELDETDNNQLVLIPGAVKFQGKAYFCHAVTYDFAEQPEQDYDLSVTLSLTDIHSPAKASPLAWQMVNCHFQGWEASAKEKKYIKLALENGAVANSEGEADTTKPLYAEILSPTAPRKDYHGFYVKYQKDDRMRCLLIPGNLPTVLGSGQFYNEKFEKKADLVIQAEHIVMSSQKVSIEAKDEVSIKGKNLVKMGNKVEVGADKDKNESAAK